MYCHSAVLALLHSCGLKSWWTIMHNLNRKTLYHGANKYDRINNPPVLVWLLCTKNNLLLWPSDDNIRELLWLNLILPLFYYDCLDLICIGIHLEARHFCRIRFIYIFGGLCCTQQLRTNLKLSMHLAVLLRCCNFYHL